MKPCIFCDSKRYERLFRTSGRVLVKCQKCGLIKTEGKKGVSYLNYHGDETYKAFEKLFKNIYQKRVSYILRFKKKPGKVLDVGASTGTFLAIFKEAGWETWGVEPSESAKVAKGKGIRMSRTTIEKAKLPRNYFDVVILNHTLEHLKNPISVLKKVRTLLKKGGIVFIDVPNFGGLSARILGKRWPFITPEEHLFHFTPQTLRRTLDAAGFEVKFWRTQSGLFECGNPPFEILLSLVTFKKRFFTNILGFPGAALVTFINRGASLSMIGEKV